MIRSGCLLWSSGQRVSFHKSKVFFSSNVPAPVVLHLRDHLGIPPTEDLGTYLGYQLIHRGRSTAFARTLLQHAESNIAGWKLRCLSKAGHITLASSVLSSLPVFQMKIRKLPEQVLKRVDRLARRCISREEAKVKKIHTVSWDCICKPKNKGGLGLWRAKDVNKTLLAKLLWRVLTKYSHTWVKLIKSKYSMRTLDDLILKPDSHASSIWRSLCWCEDLFGKGIGQSVMDGTSMLFWKDRWLGQTVLLEGACSPPPFHLLLNTVSDYWIRGVGWWLEDIQFYLPHIMLLQLASGTLCENRGGWGSPDALAWTP